MSDKSEMLSQLGRRIKYLRNKAGFDQKDLAYKAGMEFQNLSRIETGSTNATIETLAKIAKALGVRVKDLIEF